MRSLVRLYSMLAVLALLSLSGCDDGGSDDEHARIRLLNASPGYDSLDLYANGEDDDSDVLRTSNVAYDTVGGYAVLESETYTVKFKRSGVSSTGRPLTGKNLTDESHRTFVAYGSTSRFGVLELGEDVSEPDGGRASVQVLNVSEAGSLDVYLTESSVSLDDASPTFTSVASGASGGTTTVDRGDYRLRVTGASDKDDLRLDVPTISFGSKQVLTLVLTATEGGVLVNALVLPQQGNVTKYANTKARIRGAVGIANGTVVTARVGGASILSGQAVGVIGNYVQVDSGSAPVSLIVSGSPVTVPNQTLAAGGEYTLLVWSNVNGTQTTLVSDDNRLPTTSSKAKIRILNGLSALDVPVTLAVDFSPIIEGIPLGQASSFVEVDGGLEYQLDVSNTDTAVNLLSRSSVSIQSSAVYTMFVASSAATASGTFRKDR